MLYSFTKQDKLLILPAIDGLAINEVDDPELMAFLGLIPLEEAVQRLANRKMECCCLSDDLECKHSLFKEVDVKNQTSLPKSV